MSTIQLSGLQSGIDTQSIISQLVAVEKRRLTMYQDKQTTLEEKQTALGEVKTKTNTLLTAIKDLSDAGELRTYAISSSDSDIITAKATSNAYEGSHTIVINQLANSERWVSSTGETNTEDCVGEGTFIYSYNNQETSVTTSTTTTLEGLVTLINNDANNPGVTASLLNYGGIYHLILNGNDAGADNKIFINASNTEVWEAGTVLTKDGENASESATLISLDQFTGSLSGGETITISGTKHDGTAITTNTFNLTSSTKISTLISEINEAFDGEGGAVARFENGKIILTDTTCGTSSLMIDLACSSTALTLPEMTRSTEGGIVIARTDDYSSLHFTKTQEACDSQIKVDGYPPGDDNWLERDSNTISDAIDGVTLNLQDVTDAAGERITLTRDTNDLETRVGTFVSAYNALITLVKEDTDYDEETKTAGILLSDYTVSSIQQQVRLPLLTQAKGFVQGVDSYLSALNIGFSINSDGTLEFDSDDFADAVSDDYLGVLSVLGAQKTGSTDSRTISFYGSSNDNTTAGEYNVEVDVADGAITRAQIKLSSESVWRDMAIDGNIITGISTYDDNGNPDYSEHSLQLSVNVPSSGTYNYTATVNVKQGFAGAMENTLNKILDSTSGSLTIDKNSVSDQIDQIKDKIIDEEDRLTTYQERLTAKYARLEATLALLQQQMAALTGSSSA
jgi:flagellar capping protein FliD